MTRATRAGLMLVASAFSCRSVSAEVASQLDYFREKNADHCPDEAKLRQAVAERLGYDPFIEWSPRRVVTEIVVRDGRLAAIVRLVEGGGIVQSRSELSADRHECLELVHAVALAIAIHLDPDRVAGVHRAGQTKTEELPFVEASKAETAEAPPVAVRVPQKTSQDLSPRHPHVRAATPRDEATSALRLGAVYLQGLEPHVSFAFKVGGIVRYRHFQAAGELLASIPETERYAAGGIRSWGLSASLLPCLRYWGLSGCAAMAFDNVWVQGKDIQLPLRATFRSFAAGARVEFNLELNRIWSAVASFDVLRNLTQTTLRLQQSEVWRSPNYRYAFGAGVVMRFP